jgi:hypothetical protein
MEAIATTSLAGKVQISSSEVSIDTTSQLSANIGI